MTRQETRFFILMVCVFAAMFAASEIGSELVKTVVLIIFPVVFLANIRVADTSDRIYGPVWLRRAQWAFIGGILLFSILMLRVF